MLTFVNPLFLLAAASVAAPVVFHLLLRNRPRRYVLPTMRFLPESAQQSVSMHRLKNIVLLALRVLALTLIAFAFARPYFAQPAAPADPDETDEGAVFALDASMSMRAGDRWEAATKRVGVVNRSLPPKSWRTLFVFDRAPRAVCPETGEAQTLDAALKSLEPGFAATDIPAAMRTAIDAAAKMKARHRRVFLVSDFQDSGYREIALEVALPEGVELVPMNIDSKLLANAAVSALSEQPAAQGKGRRVRVQADAYGEKVLAGTLRVSAAGRDLASREVRIEAGGRVVEDFDLDLKPEDETVVTASLDLDDAVADDNRLSAVLPAHKALPVLVCTPSAGVAVSSAGAQAPPDANPYLRAAVASFGERVRASWLSPLNVAPDAVEGRRAVLVNAPEGLAPAVRESLRRHVERGGLLVLFPGDGAQTSLEDLAGLPTGGWEAAGGPDEYRLVSYTAGMGVLPALDDAGGSLLGYPKAFQYLRVTEPEASDDPPEAEQPVHALVRLDNGKPFLVERRLGAGRVYLFTVPLNPKASDMVLRAGFPAFLLQLLEHGDDAIRPRQTYTVGDALLNAPESAELTGPDGKTLPPQDGRRVLAQPGAYRLRDAQKEYALAVRIDPQECDLTPMDPKRLDMLARVGAPGAAGPKGVGSAAGLAREELPPDAASRGWWYLLFAALACMAVETLIASRTTR